MTIGVRKRPTCGECPIRDRALCARCDDDEITQLDRIKFYVSHRAGETIGVRGDALGVIASVVSGAAMLERVTEDGRTQMLGLLFPSDFIGRPGRTVLQYDVTAVSDVTLCCFERKPFERLLTQIPNLQGRLLEMALDELDAARDWMLLLGRKTAREKIASLLVMIARRTTHGADGAASFDAPITREAMANFLGLTLETVSRQFSALRRDGLIALDGARHVIVPNMERLAVEAGDDPVDDLI